MQKATFKGNENAKVLVVDDSQESLDLLIYFLKPAGYTILTAMDGEETLRSVEENPPDIILLDIMLPKIDGYEVCERIKKDKNTFHIPIIMITALKELKDKIRALEAGADDFITKPFDNVELLTRVRSLLRIKYYHDELIKRNQELEKQRETLVREDRLKKELTNLIVHDMKNPLFVIQGNLQMMEMAKEEQKESPSEIYTKRIARSSKSLLRMILNLLDISRLEQQKMEFSKVTADLNSMINDIVNSFKDIPDHRTKSVHMKLREDIPNIFVDVEVFERILENCLNYIFQNTPEYMSILVETEHIKNQSVLLKLHHDGKVIPPEFQEKIFLKNAQPELKKAGYKPARGLGLIFCRLAMEAHEAKIYLDKESTEQNCFVLEIPAYKSTKTNKVK
jgi:two-component system sensor histidine kinase/response regulator